MGQVPTRYHICLDVLDRPGVLATVAGAFADGGVSISTVRQEGRGDDATLVLVTHVACDSALAGIVARLAELPAVRKVTSVMRVAEEY
jgi:homoserine dehydrogenase